MPEIAEIARIVHYLQKSIVGKTLKTVTAQDDANVFGKVGTSGAEFQKSLTGKKVLDAGQQGKYFWLIMSSPPHPVFHFGMTGWFYIRGEPTNHYRPKAEGVEEVWPPKHWKFTLETDSKPKIEAAFTDARRFARIRLVDCAAEDIRSTTPLKENGPDPVIDKDLFTLEWFEKKMRSKHVPVKALLLDQANISGIGNWVGDEVLYNAKLHPEQYSDTFSSAQLKQLHTSIRYICQTAVDALADSSKFPGDWLFNHRWGKGKKDAPTTLPNGAKITFLTVGGRTSCVVPSVQKKTGAVAGDVDGDGVGKKANVGRKRKAGDEEGDEPKAMESVKGKGAKKSKALKQESEFEEEAVKGKAAQKSRALKQADEDDDEDSKTKAAKPRADRKTATSKAATSSKPKNKGAAISSGSRRSGRISKG